MVSMFVKYNPKLKAFARHLRNNATKSEIRLWQKLKGHQMRGYDFHRQKPIDEYIVDFYCGKLCLAIELDGYSHELEEIWKKDVMKTRRLNQLGIHVLRFSDQPRRGTLGSSCERAFVTVSGRVPTRHV